jgi:hypothetical protein
MQATTPPATFQHISSVCSRACSICVNAARNPTKARQRRPRVSKPPVGKPIASPRNAAGASHSQLTQNSNPCISLIYGIVRREHQELTHIRVQPAIMPAARAQYQFCRSKPCGLATTASCKHPAGPAQSTTLHELSRWPIPCISTLAKQAASTNTSPKLPLHAALQILQ